MRQTPGLSAKAKPYRPSGNPDDPASATPPPNAMAQTEPKPRVRAAIPPVPRTASGRRTGMRRGEQRKQRLSGESLSFCFLGEGLGTRCRRCRWLLCVCWRARRRSFSCAAPVETRDNGMIDCCGRHLLAAATPPSKWRAIGRSIIAYKPVWSVVTWNTPGACREARGKNAPLDDAASDLVRCTAGGEPLRLRHCHIAAESGVPIRPA